MGAEGRGGRGWRRGREGRGGRQDQDLGSGGEGVVDPGIVRDR